MYGHLGGIFVIFVLIIAVISQLVMSDIYFNKERPWVVLGIWLVYPAYFATIYLIAGLQYLSG